jgi:hypothetical protein
MRGDPVTSYGELHIQKQSQGGVMNKQIGLILLVAGVGLLIWGISMTGSFSSKMSRAFTGSPTDKTVTVLIAGGICTALGAYQLSRKG